MAKYEDEYLANLHVLWQRLKARKRAERVRRASPREMFECVSADVSATVPNREETNRKSLKRLEKRATSIQATYGIQPRDGGTAQISID
jgi:predicted component of type VI protein secretion system